MLVNADFSRRASVAPREYEWVASPQGGVERVMLDRLGAEKAHATSIVRYAPDSYFPQHSHPGGEEVLVLAGTFSDGAGDFPAGWYLRNPPGSSHQPFSQEGALIFVKLWQMRPAESRHVRIDTRDPAAWRRQAGREVCPLFSDGVEQVSLQRLAAGESLLADRQGGAELLVLDGSLVAADQRWARGSWLRLPAGDGLQINAGAEGASVYRKTGHLAQWSVPA